MDRKLLGTVVGLLLTNPEQRKILETKPTHLPASHSSSIYHAAEAVEEALRLRCIFVVVTLSFMFTCSSCQSNSSQFVPPL